MLSSLSSFVRSLAPDPLCRSHMPRISESAGPSLAMTGCVSQISFVNPVLYTTLMSEWIFGMGLGRSRPVETLRSSRSAFGSPGMALSLGCTHPYLYKMPRLTGHFRSICLPRPSYSTRHIFSSHIHFLEARPSLLPLLFPLKSISCLAHTLPSGQEKTKLVESL